MDLNLELAGSTLGGDTPSELLLRNAFVRRCGLEKHLPFNGMAPVNRGRNRDGAEATWDPAEPAMSLAGLGAPERSHAGTARAEISGDAR